jgi:flavin reductase (DIM6/NTAB) family NADH-FMN oxidoreductase RutF
MTNQDALTEFSPRRFRDALGCFATGVTIVSGVSASGMAVGSTVNSFSSLSLDPPLVLFSLVKANFKPDAYGPGRPYAVNILSAGQIDLSNHFARTFDNKWDTVPFDTWDTGAPIVRGALASLEGVVRSNHDGGDHWIVIGEVRRLGFAGPETEPLLYFRGKYATLPRTTG